VIIDGIKTLLTTLPYPVSTSVIDPYKVEELPAINLQYVKEDFESISQDQWYQRRTQIRIGVIVGESETYATTVKTITDLVMNKLMTDPDWFSSFKGVDNISVNYGFEDAGDVNLAWSSIDITVTDNMYFKPTFTTALHTINLNIDDIEPFDHNIVTIGPDLRSEVVWPISLPQ
jgi:hypothetical protein